MIFVFGSNKRGVHGAGAAKVAREKHGAILGKGIGHYGNSYAIPTKDEELYSLEVEDVKRYVYDFVIYAKLNPELEFQVTQIGCGLAGFTKEEIAPLFETASDNCYFDSAWSEELPGKKFWGTF